MSEETNGNGNNNGVVPEPVLLAQVVLKPNGDLEVRVDTTRVADPVALCLTASHALLQMGIQNRVKERQALKPSPIQVPTIQLPPNLRSRGHGRS